MKIELELLEPQWPNYIAVKMPTVKRKGAFAVDNSLAVEVGDLNADQVEWLCDSLRAHCLRKREES